MAIEFEYDAEQQRLVVRGDLTIYTASDAKALLLAHPGAHLDLNDVSDMDGAGLQLLLLAKREVNTVLVAASDEVLNILQLTGLQHMLEGRV